ncbi:MAG TPA: hypothetical protein VF834_22215 [Streptosporangiaceae bacterium]
MLAEALERYEQAGADAWAGRVRARLRAQGVRPAPRGHRHRLAGGWQSLTGTNRAVSLLVAEGLTNGAAAKAAVHLAAYGEYAPPARVRQAGVPNRVALATVVHHSIE